MKQKPNWGQVEKNLMDIVNQAQTEVPIPDRAMVRVGYRNYPPRYEIKIRFAPEEGSVGRELITYDRQTSVKTLTEDEERIAGEYAMALHAACGGEGAGIRCYRSKKLEAPGERAYTLWVINPQVFGS